MVYLELLTLSLIVIYIVDISGVIDSLKWALGRWLGINVPRLKPLDCSLCMVWWSGLIYIICVGECRLYTIAVVALLSALAHNISELIILAKDMISLLIDKVRNKLWN